MDVLVIKCGAQDVEELRDIRDFCTESLDHGVLVMGLGYSWSVVSLPERVKVQAKMLDQGEGDVIRAKNIQPKPKAPQITGQGAKRKQMILDRLTAYRAKHGAGCFADLEDCQGVNAALLRGLLTGLQKADLKTWEDVDKALDKLERAHG